MAEVDARQSAKTKQLVADLETARQRLKLAASEYDWAEKRFNVERVASNHFSLPPDPDVKEPK